jgi:PAS domain S-box-containing protein
MATDRFLEELTLLTPQQREQVRGAFQVALVESPLPTVLTDLEGRILGTNRLTEELLGADEAELQGRLVIELVAEEDRHLTAGVIDRLASGRTRRERNETRWVRPDGRLLWLARHVIRVDGPDGDSHSYLVALLEDVTRARLAEREAAGLADISKRIAAGASLADIAARLGDLAEQRWSKVGCMLNIADEAAGVVRSVAHSRLPAGFAEAFAEIPISSVGIPCGMAAAYGQRVAIPDLMADPRTVSMRPLLARFDIASGWSMALHDVEGKLLGTLGLFHPYMRKPDETDWEALRGFADVAAIAIMVDRRQPLQAAERVWTALQPVGAERLSPREEQIVKGLLNGDRVPAIARNLHLSQSTVRNQLTAVYRKLGVSSQQELIDLYKRFAPSRPPS